MPHASAHYGQFLRQLRGDRNVSREELSRITGVSSRTIYRAEQTDSGTMKGDNAVAIFRALNQMELMSAREIQTFMDGSGVDAEVWSRELDRLKHPPTKSSPVSRSDLRSELISEVLAIADRHDHNRVLQLLRSLSELLGIQKPATHAAVPREPFIETSDRRPYPGGGIEERKVIKTVAPESSAHRAVRRTGTN